MNATSSGFGPGTEAKAPSSSLAVLTEIKNRGVADVCIVVCDGLKGLPDAINTVWELAVVQTCIIHLIRNTFRFAARQYWDKMARDLKPVYTAPSESAAKERFIEFCGIWGERYPAIVRMWENAWTEFVPFLDYDERDPAGDLLDQCDRVRQRSLPACCACSWALPDGAGGARMLVSGDSGSGPDWER